MSYSAAAPPSPYWIAISSCPPTHLSRASIKLGLLHTSHCREGLSTLVLPGIVGLDTDDNNNVTSIDPDLLVTHSNYSLTV